jgi:hypothetical protein
MISKNEIIPGGADEHAGEFRNFGFHERRVAPCVASVNKRCGKSSATEGYIPVGLRLAMVYVLGPAEGAIRVTR